STTRFCQMRTVMPGSQLAVAKIAKATRSRTQTIVRTICIGSFPYRVREDARSKRARSEAPRSTKHPLEDAIDLFEVVFEVKPFLQFRRGEGGGYLGIGLQQLEQ